MSRSHSFAVVLLVLLGLLPGTTHAAPNATGQSLTTYPAPNGARACDAYKLTANGKDVFLYETGVHFEPEARDKTVGYAYFDATGPVDVRVTCKEVVKSLAVSPRALGIDAKIVGEHEIAFHLDKPAKVSVDINGRTDGNLIVFAGTPDPNPPSPKDPNVVYFGPGIHEVADNEWHILPVKSGQTIYVAGGAILRARIFGKDVENVTIKGRGIIDGSTLPARHPPDIAKLLGEKVYDYRPVFIDFQNARNVRIEGVHVIDSPAWTIRFDNSRDVSCRDLRLIGYVWNSDGIDIVNTIGVTVEDTFIRTADDCIVIKGLPNGDQKRLDVKDVRIEHCTLWADRASALEIGHETNANEISNVTFRDIDILDQVHDTIGYHAMDIHAGDQASIHDILYDDIRVERCQRLIGMKIEQGIYNKSDRTGKIRDVTFRNVRSADKSDINLFGHSDASDIAGITFDNLLLNGKPMQPTLRGNPFVRDLTFITAGETRKVDRIVPADLKFEPIDLASVAKQPATQPVLEDPASAVGALPKGRATLNGIPFDFPERDQRVLVVRSETEIPLDRSASRLFVLHGYTASQGKLDDVLWTYRLTYNDRSTLDVPVRFNADVCPWTIWAPGGWVVKLGQHKFYIQMIVNPHPDQPIRSITVVPTKQPGVPILLGVTSAR